MVTEGRLFDATAGRRPHKEDPQETNLGEPGPDFHPLEP